MDNKGKFTITNEEGKELECEVLFTFDSAIPSAFSIRLQFFSCFLQHWFNIGQVAPPIGPHPVDLIDHVSFFFGHVAGIPGRIQGIRLGLCQQKKR